MKPNYTAQRRAVRATWRKWDRILGISPAILVTHLWNEATGVGNDGCPADTRAEWEYRSATIRWHLPCLALCEGDELERIVVHECCHILLAPLESRLPDDQPELGEFTVEGLSRILLKLGGG